MFALYRYHAVFTDSPLPLVQAEKTVGRTHDPQSLGRPIERDSVQKAERDKRRRPHRERCAPDHHASPGRWCS